MSDAFALKENGPYESVSVRCDVCGEVIATDDVLVDSGSQDAILPALLTAATRIHKDQTGHDSVTVDAVPKAIS